MVTFPAQKIKGVIFDLDQTLIDSLQAFTEAFNRGIKPFGLDPVAQEKLASFLDKGWRMGEMLLEAFPSVFNEEEILKARETLAREKDGIAAEIHRLKGEKKIIHYAEIGKEEL